jgi:serine/threonine protein kinase
VSETGALDSGVPFIVMEHLDGRDLRSVVKHSGALDVKVAAGYVSQVCAALAEAHALGIVHRDLKPANLFLTRRPNGGALIKVLDFGIAKYTSPSLLGDQVEMTKTQAVLGSRAYMSPEQMLRPKGVDARADIWSLGVILYFFVTGRNPFTSDTTEGMIMRIVSGSPEPLTTALPDVPEDFDAIVTRCLSKRREDRFSNVTELARALAPFARHVPDRATMELDEELPRPRGIKPPEPSGPTMRGYATSEPSQPGVSQAGLSQPGTSRTSVTRVTRRSLPPVLVAVAALLGAAVVVGTFVVNTRRASGGVEAAAAPMVAQAPEPASIPIVTAPPATIAMIEDAPPAPPPSASIAPPTSAAPAAAAPARGAKPSLAKAAGSPSTSKLKRSTPATDTPW